MRENAAKKITKVREWCGQKLKARWKALAMLTLFWGLLLSIAAPFTQEKSGERKYGYLLDTLVPFKGGEVLEQEFFMPFDGFHSLILNFENHSENEQKIQVELWDDAGKNLILRETVPVGAEDDPLEYVKEFDRIGDSKQKSYRLKLVNLSKEGDDGIFLYGHANPADFESPTRINGADSGYHINFSALFQNGKTALITALMWISLLALSYLCIFFVSGDFKKDFLVIACSMGMLFLLFNPFPQPLDESTHFFRSFCISQGDWHDEINEGGQIGAVLPENYREVLGTEFSLYSWYSNRELYNQPFEGEGSFYTNPYMSSVIPIDHAVSAVGIWLGRIFHLSSALVILLSRLMDLGAFVALGYLAIRKAPCYKSIFFGVLLLPTCMFLAGSCTQDAVLIGASLYFIAICLDLILGKDRERKISVKEWLPLVLMVPFIASIKYLVYTPIFLLVLLIPSKRFEKHHKIWLSALIVLVSLVMMGYQVYLLKAFPFTEDRNGYVNVGEQIKYVLNHIYESYRNFGTYFFENILMHIENSSISSISGVAHFTGLWVVLGSVLAKDRYQWENRKDRNRFVCTISLISIVIFGLTIAALYAGFTPVGKWGVEGLQTRYIYPFLPLVCLALAHVPVVNQIKNYETKYAFIMTAANASAVASCLLSI